MPTSAVADQKGMGTGCYLGTDLGQVLVHRLGVDRRHDDRGPDASGWADRAEDMNGAMPIIAYHRRA